MVVVQTKLVDECHLAREVNGRDGNDTRKTEQDNDGLTNASSVGGEREKEKNVTVEEEEKMEMETILILT